MANKDTPKGDGYNFLTGQDEAAGVNAIKMQDPHTEPLDARTMQVDISRATEVTPAVDGAIYAMFEYHPWDEAMIARGKNVRIELANAVAVIIANVPPSPDRSAAIRKLREARMDCNSAITHAGRF